MHWIEGWTWRSAAALLTAILAACGGSSGGTGPSGDLDQIAGDYGLAQVDSVAAPVTIDFDNCGSIRFTSAAVSLAEDGTWDMTVRLVDVNGDEQEFQDDGHYQRAGDRLAFQSDEYGDHFAGEVDDPLVHLYYDWCGEGHPDADFAFTR